MWKLYNLHVSSKLAYEVSIALAMMRDISRTAPVWVCVHVKVDALAALRHDVQMGSALMMSTGVWTRLVYKCPGISKATFFISKQFWNP